ncbi:MAG: recombinase RecT [Pontiellaceae bacterium]|nr:recombinase RecT [Pontiellaceae bacterium]MBN2786485.1 recombinase RecT [Pontiellaceae bacterium]
MTNAVATAQQGNNVLTLLQSEKTKHEWAKVLPSILTPDRMARVAVSQVRRVPKLLECSQPSLLGALMTCAELGLEPNGRHAHLIPYGKECQLIIDFKGLAELAMRSGKISRLHADVICENDQVSIENGIISHKINPLKDRGTMIGAYAMCAFKDGSEKHEYMSKAEIDGIRARSRAGKSGPWVTDYNEMAKKTVFRRMSKWLPLSPEVQETLNKDADTLDPNGLPSKMAEGITVESPIESGDLLGEEQVSDDAVTSMKETEPPEVGKKTKNDSKSAGN